MENVKSKKKMQIVMIKLCGNWNIVLDVSNL